MSNIPSHPFWIPAVMLITLTLVCIPLSAYLVFTEGKTVMIENAPDVYFSSGIKLQVSESRTATVFGYDECPVAENSVLLFPIESELEGCTMLTGKDLVKVRLLNEDGSIVIQTWSVSNDKGKFTVMTPDGFLVRLPS